MKNNVFIGFIGILIVVIIGETFEKLALNENNPVSIYENGKLVYKGLRAGNAPFPRLMLNVCHTGYLMMEDVLHWETVTGILITKNVIQHKVFKHM